LHHLRAFAVLAEERHFTRAAEKLGVTLLRERRVAAVSTHHPLADAEEVRWLDIAAHRLVFNEVSGATELTDWPPGCRPGVRTVCRNFDEWLEAVAANRGVGIVPEFVGRKHIHPLVEFLPIPDAPLVPLHLVHRRRGAHLLAEQFVRMAVEDLSGTG
jgi:DNA-binding transcriptional LysR family regulator